MTPARRDRPRPVAVRRLLVLLVALAAALVVPAAPASAAPAPAAAAPAAATAPDRPLTAAAGGAVKALKQRAAAAPGIQALLCQRTYFWFFTRIGGSAIVSAELGYTGGNYGQLRARAGTVGPWEWFDVCYDEAGDWFAIKGPNGRWVSVEMGYVNGSYAMLRARATAVGPWEKFNFVTEDVEWRWFWVQSRHNGKWLVAPGSNRMVRAVGAQGYDARTVWPYFADPRWDCYPNC